MDHKTRSLDSQESQVGGESIVPVSVEKPLPVCRKCHYGTICLKRYGHPSYYYQGKFGGRKV